MAWFGESLSSLSNLKGQITNFTKEVLSDGIVDEIDERSKELKEANERCSQLQDLLTTKDAEISLLRRQNGELQRAVIEINAKSKESKDTGHIDGGDGTFWDTSCVDNRNGRNQNHARQLQEQLAQATVKVRELECELKRVQKVNNTSLRDDISDGHQQKAEVVRAKQDMMNRIIQMEEKTREAERNAKYIQLDEASLINDFRSVISKLKSREKIDLVNGALKALQIESESHEKIKDHEKSNEENGKVDFEYSPSALRHHIDAGSQQSRPYDANDDFPMNKEEMQRSQKIIQLENENRDLREALEKLDEEHAQSIEKLLSLREETNKKYRSLQIAYEQLSIDYNETQKRIIELRNNESTSNENDCPETSCRSVQTDNAPKLEKHTQSTIPSTGNDAISETNALDEIAQRVKTILKSHAINSNEPGESIFETVAKQYIDVKWKVDVLERKITEITRDLKENEEMKDGMQIECEELQSHIDSLLLENQALKSNLPSIPEASEDRVISLEMDVESLRDEVKRLSIENETIRETNTTLINLTSHDNSQKDTNRLLENEELPIFLEKHNESDEGVPLIERLRFDYENIKRELQLSISKTTLLESNLASLHDAVNKLEEEKKDLLQKNKYLDTQLYDRQECNLQEENDHLLDELRGRLDAINREKFDLKNDILRKESELDVMRIQIDTRQSQVLKLSQDNERLIKENISLSEQLTATHDESLDKIELLNTEMSLLQQEHEDLRQEASSYKGEFAQTKEKLRETRERYGQLEDEYHALKARYERLELEKKNISSREKSGNETSLKELSSLREKCQLLEQEIVTLRTKQTHRLESQQPAAAISSVNIDKKIREELSTVEDNSVKLENLIARAQTERRDSTAANDGNVAYGDNERQTLESIVDEERREKDIIKAHNESLMGEIVELRGKLQIAFENNKESAGMAKQTIEDLSRLVGEKDREMNVLRDEMIRANDVIARISDELGVTANRRNELEQLISVKHNEILQYQNEMQMLIQRVNEQAAHIQGLISEQTASDKTNLQAQQKGGDEIDRIVDQSAIVTGLNKKCDALEAALMQEQSSNRILQNQLNESQNKEANSARDLERLRTHLVEMESSYTEEALISERNHQELEARLLQAEEKVKSSSTAFTSANIRANQQVETLQQQITLIAQQRDQIQAKLSVAEDNMLLQSASLTNLQIVLEQFQQDKDRDVMSATERIRSQLEESYKKQDEFLNEISILKQQLSEAKECLQAASRLSEQLERKDDQIEQLSKEVAQLTTAINAADQKMKEALEHDEEKVDKILVKNLLLGYLSSATSDKSSILRVFANVLDFTESEKDKTGLSGAMGQSSGWLLGANKNNGASSKNEEASLSMAFVRFLESESKPKPQLPALPIVNSPSLRPGYNKQSSASSTQSTLLSNVALPTFPDFVPARNTGSILKEVLKDS